MYMFFLIIHIVCYLHLILNLMLLLLNYYTAKNEKKNAIKSWDLYNTVVNAVSGHLATNHCFELWFMDGNFLLITICLYFNKVTSGETFQPVF